MTAEHLPGHRELAEGIGAEPKPRAFARLRGQSLTKRVLGRRVGACGLLLEDADGFFN